MMLNDFPLFECLTEPELELLEKVAAVKTYPRNTIIFNAGDPSDSFYAIRKGRVSVGMNDEEGREVILSILGEGDYFGEMALVDDEPRSATVITRQVTELLVISKTNFKRILENNPGISFNLLKGLQKRLREANRKIESLALMNVYDRVIRLLVQMAENGPEGIIQEKLTHQEIANLVGSSREMVSRVLKHLIREGFISVEKKQITLLKQPPLNP